MINLKEVQKSLEKFKKITFYEEPHVYTWTDDDGKFGYFGISVTTLVGKYEQPFDEEKVAEQIAKKEKTSKENILAKWHFERDLACEKGTALHYRNEMLWRENKICDYNPEYFIELFGYDALKDIWNKLAKISDSFYKKFHDRIIPIGLEQYVGSKYYDVCGAIDFLAYSKKLDALIIIDYKTNKEIKTESYKYNMMLPPFDYIMDCNFYHYSLQLAIYKVLLEHETNLKISSHKWLIWMNETQDDFVLYECANLDEEAKKILELRRKEIESRR